MESFEPYIFNAAYLCYTLAMVGYFLFAWSKKESWGGKAYGLVIAGVLLHLADFALRAYVGRVDHGLKHYVPWSNWFESFSLFAFVIAVTFIAVQRIYRLDILGAF